MRKTNQKRRRKQKRKTLKKKGGATGAGQFGTVFYNPRPLCADENEITPQMYNEAGKISFNEAGNYDLALQEYNVLKLIETKGKEHTILDAVEQASKYINLPLKNCLVNPIMDPKKENLKDAYKSKWAKDSEFRDIATAIDKNYTMTVYPKMKVTVRELIYSTYDVKGIFEIVLGFENIINGILFLGSIGLMHYDVHFDNVMVSDDGTYKMIDITPIYELDGRDRLRIKLHQNIEHCVQLITKLYLKKEWSIDYIVPDAVEEFMTKINSVNCYDSKNNKLIKKETVEEYIEVFKQVMEIVRDIVDKMDNVSGKKRKSEEEMTGSSKKSI